MPEVKDGHKKRTCPVFCLRFLPSSASSSQVGYVKKILRQVFIFVFALVGSVLLLYGCQGSEWDWRYRWEYQPEGFPLPLPQCLLLIEGGGVAGHCFSLAPSTGRSPKKEVETIFYDWYDSTPAVAEKPVYRQRMIIIWPRALQFFGALLLAWPVTAFVRGPFRRYRRRSKGQCVRCGYDLTGNVSGICPECGLKLSVQVRRSHRQKIVDESSIR